MNNADEYCKQLGSAVYQRDRLLENIKMWNAKIEELKRRIYQMEEESREPPRIVPEVQSTDG